MLISDTNIRHLYQTLIQDINIRHLYQTLRDTSDTNIDTYQILVSGTHQALISDTYRTLISDISDISIRL